MKDSSPTLSTDTKASGASTPMLKQYNALKAKHQDCILFFRLGDFYEMFFDDAKAASRALDLVLTSRGKTPSQKIPMCGVPHHAADSYIAKLIKKGFKVAICDQVEDPAVAKGIVKRDVTRIISSGTYLDEQNSDARYLLCLSFRDTTVGFSFIDPSSGTIQTNQYVYNKNLIAEKISNLSAYECVYPEDQEATVKSLFTHSLLKQKDIMLSPLESWCFSEDMAYKFLCEHFKIKNLHGFGLEDKSAATASCSALLEYLKMMNKQPLEHIDKIATFTDDDYCLISSAAMHGLELNTLIKTVDYTLTPLGRRKFRHWFTHPLKTKDTILTRQKGVQILLDDKSVNLEIKDIFSQIGDIEKNLSRLSCGYTHAKDLLAIRNALALIPDLKQALMSTSKKSPLFDVEDIGDLRTLLISAVNENVPLSKPEGHVIRPGFNKDLDELRRLQQNGRNWLKKYQEDEIKRTQIPSLKIGFNKVFGYYLEVTKTHMKSVPADYIRKQTLANAERYITPELKEYEEKILTAEDKVIKIEQALIAELRSKILAESRPLHLFCDRIAVIDCLYSLAYLAQSPNYCLPKITEDLTLHIKEGRHPVVENMTVETFIANDTLLDCDQNHLMILTGPNMSGKSTYIRQTAILVIMAQIGSFIPAASAEIGLVDKIFTRIGAHDDIAKGQSTFMVEMNETADILNNLTDNSLVILDEIGRGTSTFDGLSLAWALAEYLAAKKVRTMFATHFHELTALSDEHGGVKNYNVAVKEWKDEIIFLHKIIPGSTDDSYGIYVAKLAGLPKEIISRAKKVLTQIELKSSLKEDLRRNFSKEEQVTLFAQNNDPQLEKLKNEIENIDVNSLTPIEALNRLQQLKENLQNE